MSSPSRTSGRSRAGPTSLLDGRCRLALPLLLLASLAWAKPPAHDFGRVVAPPGIKAGVEHTQPWRLPRLPPGSYSVTYRLGAREDERVGVHLQKLGEATGYKAIDATRFQVTLDPECPDFMRCVYQALADRSGPLLIPLARRLGARIFQERLSVREAATLILGYVQAIPYEIPEKLPFGVLPPAQVGAHGTGDCDSKALLALLLLRHVGFDAVLLHSQALQHTAVGVALPGKGDSFGHRGKRYHYVEVTATGWPVGKLPPELDVPKAWKVLPIDVRTPRR